MASYTSIDMVRVVDEMTYGLFLSQGKIEFLYIMKTCQCNEYPLIPHFYIAKLGYVGVYLFFLFLLQNIDCGYSLEPPCQCVPTIYVLSRNKKIIKKILLKIFIFYNFNNLCILHGHVFVMSAKNSFYCRWVMVAVPWSYYRSIMRERSRV